jgi:glutamate carboxypeptidase
MVRTSLLAATVLLAITFVHDVSRAAAPDSGVLSAAEAARSEQLRLLESLVNIDSGTGDVEGGRKVASVLIPRLKALGMTIESVPAEAPGLPENTVASLNGGGRARILLIGHIDTVFEPGTAARRPFRTDERRAYGPGVADEKGGVVVVSSWVSTRSRSCTISASRALASWCT